MVADAAYMRKYRAEHPDYKEKDNARRKNRRASSTQQERDKERDRLAERARKQTKFYQQAVLVVDGEADEDGNYRYLAAYDGTTTHTLKLPIGVSITFPHAMHWLYSITKRIEKATSNKVGVYWFSFGYDVDRLIGDDRELSLTEIEHLVSQKRRSYGTLRDDSFTKERVIPSWKLAVYAGKKVVDIRFLKRDKTSSDGILYDEDGKAQAWGRLHMEDVWSLTARSFVSTIEKICKPAWNETEQALYQPLLDKVKIGKQARGTWDGMTEKDILSYNEAELILLHWYVRYIIGLCEREELLPRSLAGPAPIARALCQKYDAHRHLKPSDYDSVEFQHSAAFAAIRQSYFGGRIEASGQGNIPAGWHEYDLSSAYPHALSTMPCLAHGEFHYVQVGASVAGQRQPREAITLAPMAVYHVRWMAVDKASGNFGPFPVRYPDHTIAYPMAGEGWYCTPEIQAFLDTRTRHARLEIIEGYVWESTCDNSHPFSFIEDVFERRKLLIEQGDGAEVILKVALNSIYGVTAQVVGGYRKLDEDGNTIGYGTGKFSNLFAASFITSTVRASIYRACRLTPDAVVMCMTDAVYTTQPLDLPCPAQKTLGQWEHTQHDAPLFIIAPGITASPDAKVSKRRGMEVGLAYQDVWDGWEEQTRKIEQHIKRYVSLREAITHANGVSVLNRETWGTFADMTRVIDLSPQAVATKRIPIWDERESRQFHVYPPRFPSGMPSVIYRRAFDIPDNHTAAYERLSDVYETTKDRLSYGD